MKTRLRGLGVRTLRAIAKQVGVSVRSQGGQWIACGTHEEWPLHHSVDSERLALAKLLERGNYVRIDPLMDGGYLLTRGTEIAP